MQPRQFVFIIDTLRLEDEILLLLLRRVRERGAAKSPPSAITTHFKLQRTDFLSGGPCRSPGVIAHTTYLHSMQCVRVPPLLSQGISCLTICLNKSSAFRQSSKTPSKKRCCHECCVKATELVFGQLKNGWRSRPSRLEPPLFFDNLRTLLWACCHRSTLKYTEMSFGGSVSRSGPTKYRCQQCWHCPALAW